MAKKSRARKTSDTPCKIYSYGIKLSRESEAQLRDHMRLACDFYNGLVDIENGRRDAYRAARSAAVPAYAAAEGRVRELDEQLEEVRAEINRGKARSRTDDLPAELAVAAKAIKDELREASAFLKGLRKEADADHAVRAEAERIDALVNGEIVQREPKVKRGDGLVKNYRKHHPLFWTTQGRVSDAFMRAKADTRFRLRRKHFDGTGSAGGQILKCDATDGYLTTESLFGEASNFLQLEPLPSSQWDTLRGRRKAYSRGRIRIGSDGRSPIWLEFSALIHRPLPRGAVIKNAWVLARKCGNRMTYELQLTVESGEFCRVPHGKIVAVTLGWASNPGGGARIATAMSADTEKRDMHLPLELFQRFQFCDALRSAQSIHFDAARAALSDYVDTNDVPPWLTEEVRYMANWRSPRRLARIAWKFCAENIDQQMLFELWEAWKTERLADGLDLFDSFDVVAAWSDDAGLDEAETMALYLDIWRRKNTHLYQYECDIRRKATAMRDDLFSQWVASFRNCKLVLEEKSFKAACRKADPEDEDDAHEAMRRFRSRAAPGRLGELIKAVAFDIMKAEVHADMVGLDPMAARCVSILEACGEDTTAIKEMVSEQREILGTLRDAAE